MSAASEERSGKPARGCLVNGPLIGAFAWFVAVIVVGMIVLVIA